MPHCDSFKRSLANKLNEKKTIDDMCKELCNHTKDPRRNLILDIKEEYGEDYLIANADWLDYQIQKHEKVKVASDCNLLSIVPLSTVSATSVVPEASMSGKVEKDNLNEETPIEILARNFMGWSEKTPKIDKIVESEARIELPKIEKIEKMVDPVRQKSVPKNSLSQFDQEIEISCSNVKIVKEKNKNKAEYELEEIELCPCKSFGYLIKKDKWFIIRLSGRDNKQIKSLERKISTDDRCIFCAIELCPCGDFGYNIAEDLWFTTEKIYELRNRNNQR